MIRLNDVQTALITRLKATSMVTSLLPLSYDIREVSWQGTDFKYPNIRVRVSQFVRKERGNANCKLFSIEAQIYVFADDASSQLGSEIASEVFELFDTVSYSDAVVKLQGIQATQSGAVWIEERGDWRNEVSLTALASAK